MTDFHRKIELQSPEDLRYLILKARHAADAQIDAALPRMEGEDPMRARMETLVHEYITRLYTAALPNITINGLPASPSLIATMLHGGNGGDDAAGEATAARIKVVEEHEPFNTKLFAQLKDLARQEEDLTEAVAKLRRENPHLLKRRAVEEWRVTEEADAAALAGLADGAVNAAGTAGDLDIKPLEREREVEKAWRDGLQGLERLKRTLPETVAKKERAEKAEAYVLGK